MSWFTPWGNRGHWGCGTLNLFANDEVLNDVMERWPGQKIIWHHRKGYEGSPEFADRDEEEYKALFQRFGRKKFKAVEFKSEPPYGQDALPIRAVTALLQGGQETMDYWVMDEPYSLSGTEADFDAFFQQLTQMKALEEFTLKLFDCAPAKIIDSSTERDATEANVWVAERTAAALTKNKSTYLDKTYKFGVGAGVSKIDWSLHFLSEQVKGKEEVEEVRNYTEDKEAAEKEVEEETDIKQSPAVAAKQGEKRKNPPPK